MANDILFSVMTEREAVFFSEIASRLKVDGCSPAFVTYHEAADSFLQKAGFEYYSLHKLRNGYLANASANEAATAETEFKLKHFRTLYSHEIMTTRRKDHNAHV